MEEEKEDGVERISQILGACKPMVRQRDESVAEKKALSHLGKGKFPFLIGDAGKRVL